MRLPKYKQPMLEKYNNTDFSDLTAKEKEVFDKIFFSSLKSSYCVATLAGKDEEYYKNNMNIVKSLANKGLIKKVGSLISVSIIHEILKQRQA